MRRDEAPGRHRAGRPSARLTRSPRRVRLALPAQRDTRYLGGAFRRGGVAELVDSLVGQGIGLCQMPCPEQHAWGGVLKRHMLRAYGTGSSPIYRLRRPLLRLFILYTSAVYRHLARDITAQIADYQRSGCTVVAIIGVGASPLVRRAHHTGRPPILRRHGPHPRRRPRPPAR